MTIRTHLFAVYEWADAKSEETGKSSKVTEGFAWFTIRPGNLSYYLLTKCL